MATAELSKFAGILSVSRFLFLGSKITADSDCSHGIERHLLLGRKAVTNLDSRLEIRGITLLIKVHIVKAVVFLVVMYGCESRPIKSTEELLLLNYGDGEVPGTARRSNQSILKAINPKYSLEGLMLKLKLQYFGHLMRKANSLERTLMVGEIEGKRRRSNIG